MTFIAVSNYGQYVLNYNAIIHTLLLYNIIVILYKYEFNLTELQSENKKH